MSTHLSYVGIIVGDIAQATAYYRDRLGLPVDEVESVPGRYTQFALEGGAMLSLLAAGETAPGQAYEPGLLVEDADATFAAWRGRGVELLEEPHDMPFGRTFRLRTPDGHVIRAYQRPA